VYPQLEVSVAVIEVLPAVAYLIVYVWVAGVDIVEVSAQVESVIEKVLVYEVARLSLKTTLTDTSLDPAESDISVEVQETTQPTSSVQVGQESPLKHVAV